MIRASALLGHAAAYRLLQAPFADRKLAPMWRHVDLARVRRVLDVGCGPGTNAGHFTRVDYLGVDADPAYVRHARRRFGERFQVADVLRDPLPEGPFDVVLVNSVLHHLDDAGAAGLLARLRAAIGPEGHLHVVDLVLPETRGIARALARLDRGDHPRSEAEWRRLLAAGYEPAAVERYAVGLMGATLWEMLYFKGKPRR